jgi:hypothetical protein
MNIVTIMNYDWNNINYFLMCFCWIKQAKKHLTQKDICFIFSKQELPKKLLKSMEQSETCQFKNCVVDGIEDSIVLPSYGCLEKKYENNVKYKLFVTTHIEFTYFFIDADAFIVDCLQEVEDIIYDKPATFIDHEIVPGHTNKLPLFLNSGSFLINDPNKNVYNWEKIYDHGKKCGFSPVFKKTQEKIPGTDQAVIMSYFDKIGYNYHHKKFDIKYNTCAANVVFEYKNTSDEYQFRTQDTPVKIVHYWGPFKPWKVNCPIFKEAFNDQMLNNNTFLDKTR